MTKQIKTFFEVMCEMFKPMPTFDRISLEMMKFCVPEFDVRTKLQEQDLVTYIPQDYLYSRLHEIEDETWNYVVNIHPGTIEKEIVNQR